MIWRRENIQSLIDQLYRLDDAKIGNTKKTFYINAADFTVNRQEITQTAESRMIQVAYADNKVFTKQSYLQMWLSKRFNLKGSLKLI
jgi:hypothetical protein